MQNIHVSTEEGNILVLTFVGEIKDVTDIESFKYDLETVADTVKQMSAASGHGIKVLIDVTHFTANYVSEGVDALVDLAEHDESLVERTAIFGGSLKVRAIGETIIVTANRKNIKFFKTKAESIAWLKSEVDTENIGTSAVI